MKHLKLPTAVSMLIMVVWAAAAFSIVVLQEAMLEVSGLSAIGENYVPRFLFYQLFAAVIILASDIIILATAESRKKFGKGLYAAPLLMSSLSAVLVFASIPALTQPDIIAEIEYGALYAAKIEYVNQHIAISGVLLNIGVVTAVAVAAVYSYEKLYVSKHTVPVADVEDKPAEEVKSEE